MIQGGAAALLGASRGIRRSQVDKPWRSQGLPVSGEAQVGRGGVRSLPLPLDPGIQAPLLVDVTTGSSACCAVRNINLSRCSLSGICSFHLLKAEAFDSGKSARRFVLPCGTDLGPLKASCLLLGRNWCPQKVLGAAGHGWH